MAKFETRRGKIEREKRQRRYNMIALLLAVVMVVALCIALWSGKQSLEKDNAMYESRKVELEEQYAQEESRSSEIEEYSKYVKTKKFIEKMAKDKFGLIYPEDIILKPAQ